METRYQLICNHCSYKVLTDGSENLKELIEIPTAPIQKKGKDFLNQTKKFKCPKCGYIFHISKLKSDENKKDDSNLEKKDNSPEIKW